MESPAGAEVLDPFEIRVLAVLAEKEALTPDNYPLSLNALVNGCNQLSSRDPVMSISEETVADVLQRLMQRKYVNGITQAGARQNAYTTDDYTNYHITFAKEDLEKMLEMGQSRPWPEALKVVTGQEKRDATAIIDYFAPLKTWLDQQNAGKTQGW